MISRGTLIGKIIDDLANLHGSIELRNKVGLFDLTKVSEDFFKEILNIIYGLELINLNEKRNNEPGIDLGDKINKIAYQITSTKTSQKINKTLEKLTDDQLKSYSKIKILIIGQKQSSYTIDDKLLMKVKFSPKNDIIDIVNVTKDIAVLSIDRLEILFTFFKRSFQELIIELEPMDIEGNFKSSIYNYIESIPNKPPKNVNRINSFYNEEYNLENYIELYHKLASIPKTQREYICLIAERGKLDTLGVNYQYEIHCTKLAAILNIEEDILFGKLAYLEEERMVCFSSDTDEYNRAKNSYYIRDEQLNYLITFLKEAVIPMRRILVGMDFSLLEKI